MEPRVATPIVSKNTAQPGKAVSITIETAPEEENISPEGANPIDPNSPEERQELIPQQSWQTDPLFYEMANYLGLEQREYDVMAEKVSVITDYAIREAGSNKIEDIMYTLRQLEDKLQPPPWGQSKASHLYQFLRLESRYEASRKALGALTKTGKWG